MKASPDVDKQENKLTESESDLESSEPIYSDPVDDFASSSHEEEEEEEEDDDLDILGSLKKKNKIVDIGRHIKMRKKGHIGGKIVCDHNGCHPVDYSDESSL